MATFGDVVAIMQVVTVEFGSEVGFPHDASKMASRSDQKIALFWGENQPYMEADHNMGSM